MGVWRTVGGRRIYIEDGEDLKTAMDKSGKFGSKGWDYRGVGEKLDEIEKEIDAIKDPFSRKTAAIYERLQGLEKTLLKYREEIRNGTENGDIKALARYNTRIKLLKNKIVNIGIRKSAGR